MRGRALLALALLGLAGCGSSAPRAGAPVTQPAPAPARRAAATAPRPAARPPRPARSHGRVAPLPPPVADPRPAAAAPSGSVSPGAPSDAEVKQELRQALGLKHGASERQLVDLAELTPAGLAVAPPSAPPAVDAVISAGNRVARAPYVYGGGHGTWIDSAYDCSGSVSFALVNAGLVRSQLDSTAFEHWGRPGPGRWITVYANAGHAWMVVAGVRFDTSGRAGPRGSRWQPQTRGTGGFVARHPVGL